MQALGDRFYSTATHISATAIRLPPASHIYNLNWNLHANLGVFGYARHLLVERRASTSCRTGRKWKTFVP